MRLLELWTAWRDLWMFKAKAQWIRARAAAHQ